MEGITWTEGVTWKEGITWTEGVTCMYVCMYVFKRQLEARGHLEGARHLDGGRRLETGRRASSLVRSRDIAFGSGQGVHALSIPHLRYLRHSSYAPVRNRLRFVWIQNRNRLRSTIFPLESESDSTPLVLEQNRSRMKKSEMAWSRLRIRNQTFEASLESESDSTPLGT